MFLQKAERRHAKIKMCLQGPSGSGKSYSALLIAYGLCQDWSKIAVIDSENQSASLYAHLGEYNTLSLTAPFTPEKYMEAIDLCEKAGMEVILIDSATHEWENLLDYHSSLQGNSFTNWGKVTPRHNAFVQRILQCEAHVICTLRTKTDYVMAEKNGKMVPEKVGLKSVQREGLEYELTLVFELDIKNHATCSKDRTGLFFGKPEQKLTIETGKKIINWCNEGSPESSSTVSQYIQEVSSINELRALYYQYPQFQVSLKPEFESKKRALLLTGSNEPSFSNTSKSFQNGTV